jgi:hypothetical protein
MYYYLTPFSGIMRGVNLTAINFGTKPTTYQSIPLIPSSDPWYVDATQSFREIGA